MPDTLEKLRPSEEISSGSIDGGNSNLPDFLQNRMESSLPPDFETKVNKINRQIGSGTSQRIALLGLVLAVLEDVPFHEIALLVDVKENRLIKLMHGEEQIQTKFEERGVALVEIAQNLHKVLKHEATSKWLKTAIPRLEDKTPLEAIQKGELNRVLELTRSYLNQNFL